MSDDVQRPQTPDPEAPPPPVPGPETDPLLRTPEAPPLPPTPVPEAPPLSSTPEAPPLPPIPEAPPLPPIPETAPQPATVEWMFGEDYVRQVLRWSIVLAALGGVVGWLITTEVAFALGLWIGAALDIATFREVAKRGVAAIEGKGSNVWPISALLVRLAMKGVLLLLAVWLWQAAFWGVLFGVLVVEFMIVVVGIVRSSATMYGARGGPGGRAKS